MTNRAKPEATAPVIARAEPEAIQKMSTTWIASRFVPRVRNDEQGIEVLFSEEVC
ncbi:MAG: hypothetical protein LBV26_04085 [Bacteroidales bacterium]|jgi:hypothetical protein|nr:hypothetical protein [Bacteroidales bacterium]